MREDGRKKRAHRGKRDSSEERAGIERRERRGEGVDGKTRPRVGGGRVNTGEKKSCK